jgi:RNA polymerase sigma-70 factor (ECF subfamily)
MVLLDRVMASKHVKPPGYSGMQAPSRDVIVAELPALLPRLWRYGLILSRDPVAAEDLVQATALRALERSSQFVAGTRLDRWLFSILRSIWLNQLRALRIRTGHGLVDAEDALVSDGAEQIETNILAGQVLRQAMGLPEAQRETLLLVYVEGFTYQEAANVLDVPIGTVMSRLAAVRLKLGGIEAPAAQNKDRDVD